MKKNFILSFFIFIVLVSGTSAFFYFRYKKINSKSVEINETPHPVRTASTTGAIKVPILVYHSVKPYSGLETEFQKIFDVEPANFGKQLLYLKDNGYNAITFDDLVSAFAGGQLPAKPVIISFDDGWQNQYQYAFPLLKQANIKATFFIYTNAIDQLYFLTWDQVRELRDAGMSIGGHTKSHPYLWKITDPLKLEDEIIDSKKIIEDHLSQKISAFAYPFGRYSEQAIIGVKKAGYTSARSTFAGDYHTQLDLFTLSSIQADNDLDKFITALQQK